MCERPLSGERLRYLNGGKWPIGDNPIHPAIDPLRHAH